MSQPTSLYLNRPLRTEQEVYEQRMQDLLHAACRVQEEYIGEDMDQLEREMLVCTK
jgi:hypothetical protein